MTTYTTITNSQVDTDSPIDQALMTALRDNPLAIVEGSANAPVNQWAWHPYNMTDVDDGNDGEFYNHSTDGTVATVETPAFADGYEYKVIFEDVSNSSAGNNTLYVDIYHSTNAAYSSPGTITTTFPGSESMSGEFRMLGARLDRKVHVLEYAAHHTSTGTNAGVAGTLGTHTATAQKVGKLRFRFTGSNIDAGTMYLMRRIDARTIA